MGKGIIDMTRAIILNGNMHNDLWPKLVLIITYIKNCYPTGALNNFSPYKVYFYK